MVKFLSRRGFPAYLSGSTALLLVGLAAGCRREEISVYDVPKNGQTETGRLSRANEAPATEPAPSTAANEQHWNAPPEWKSQQPGPMQDAKFLAADGKAVITISIFEGSAGGVLANVNRWRTQLQLPPVDEAGLSSLITSLDSAGEGAKLVDMNGPKQRMVAAIVPRGSKTSFFKLLGDPSWVDVEKERFIAFIKSAKS